MRKNELKGIIKEQYKKEIKEKIIERESLEKLDRKSPFIKIITGIRRCGKSVLLNSIRDTEDGHYLNFDDERLVNFNLDNFQDSVEIFEELYGKKDVFYFDEIQNIDRWELFIRRLRDNGKKVYLTGSNATMLSKELGTRLTGRYIKLELYPFSFREFLLLRYKSCKDHKAYSSEEKAEIKRLFNEYLSSGGMPEYLKTGNNEYLKTLYESILYRDILTRNNLTNEKPLKELVHFIASNISKEISFNSLKKLLGLGSPTTVKEYFDYLENTYLIFLVPKFSPSLKKQVYSSKKAYFIDNGLALSIGYRLSKDYGRLLENLIFVELKRKGYDIYYHREKKECDFIAKKESLEAIQVCYELNEDNKEREIDGLLEAMKKLRLKKGMILTYDQEEEITIDKKKIIVKPAWKWLLEKNKEKII